MAQSTDVWRLAVAELALYVIILPIVIYILIRHGKHGIDGWGFLIVFCILRLTSSGIQVGSKNDTSTTGAIINSIGVSGLLLAFAGILHEVGRTYILFRPRLGQVLALWFHILVVTGIVLAAIGGSNLTKSGRTSDQIKKDHDLQKAGYSLLVLSVALLFGATFVLLLRLRTQVKQRKAAGAKLLYFVLVALVFGLVRVLYGLVAAVSSSRDLSPVTGTFAVKLVLIFLVQIIAALLLVIGGLQSRNMRHEIKQVPGERLEAQYR